MSTVTFDEALRQAVQMHSQKVPYVKIADHLKAIGYISAKTKKPVGHMAVRQMVENAKARDKKEAKEDAKEMKAHSPAGDALSAINEISAMRSLGVKVKLDLIKKVIDGIDTNSL